MNKNFGWWLVGLYKGIIITTRLYREYIVNHKKDPYSPTRIQWKVGPGLNLVAQMRPQFGGGQTSSTCCWETFPGRLTWFTWEYNTLLEIRNIIFHAPNHHFQVQAVNLQGCSIFVGFPLTKNALFGLVSYNEASLTWSSLGFCKTKCTAVKVVQVL